jgi:hypothetical protein
MIRIDTTGPEEGLQVDDVPALDDARRAGHPVAAELELTAACLHPAAAAAVNVQTLQVLAISWSRFE